MPVSIVNAGTQTSGVSSTSFTDSPSVGIPAGVLAIAVVAYSSNPNVAGLTDTDGHTWTSEVTTQHGTAPNPYLRIYTTHTTSEIAVGDVLTFTNTTAVTNKADALCYVTGWPDWPPMPQTVTGTSAGTVTSLASSAGLLGTAGQAYNLYFGAHYHMNGNATGPKAGWTELHDIAVVAGSRLETQYEIANGVFSDGTSSSWTTAALAVCNGIRIPLREFESAAGGTRSARLSAPLVNYNVVQRGSRYRRRESGLLIPEGF